MKKLLIRAFIAIVLTIGLVTSSISIANAEEKATATIPEYACGPEDVDTLYPDPNNRSSFYQCAPYGLVLQSCPNGLVFDENVGRCEWDSQPAKETEAKN